MTSPSLIRSIQSYIKLVVWIVVIGLLCFSSGEHMSELRIGTLIPAWLAPHFDKVIHFSMFFILVFIIKTLHWQSTIGTRLLAVYLIMTVIYAASTELIQHFFIVTRSGDVYDFVADIIGMGMSIAAFPYWPRFLKIVFG